MQVSLRLTDKDIRDLIEQRVYDLLPEEVLVQKPDIDFNGLDENGDVHKFDDWYLQVEVWTESVEEEEVKE